MSVIATPTLVGLAALLIGEAGDGHQPADGLGDEVVARLARVGSIRPVAGDRQVNETRVELGADGRRRSPSLAMPAGTEVLDQDVRPTDQPPRGPPAPSGCRRSRRRLRLFRFTARK